MKKNFKINEADPLFYNKPYNKIKRDVSGGDELQAVGKSIKSDLEDSAAKFGMGGEVDYYLLTSMNQPFSVDFKFIETSKKDVSYTLRRTPDSSSTVDTITSKENYSCKIFLNPKTLKKLNNGELEKKNYRFKIVDGDGEGYFLVFKSNQINVHNKITNKIVPQLNTRIKYDVMVIKPQQNILTTSILKIYDVLNEMLNERNKIPFDPIIGKLQFSSIKIKGIKMDDDRDVIGYDNDSLSFIIFEPKNKTIDQIDNEATGKGFSSGEIKNILNHLGNIKLSDNKNDKRLEVFLGKTSGGKKNVLLNIPYNSTNGSNGDLIKKNLFNGYNFNKCKIVLANPNNVLISDDIDMKLKIKNK